MVAPTPTSAPGLERLPASAHQAFQCLSISGVPLRPPGSQLCLSASALRSLGQRPRRPRVQNGRRSVLRSSVQRRGTLENGGIDPGRRCEKSDNTQNTKNGWKAMEMEGSERGLPVLEGEDEIRSSVSGYIKGLRKEPADNQKETNAEGISEESSETSQQDKATTARIQNCGLRQVLNTTLRVFGGWLLVRRHLWAFNRILLFFSVSSLR
ncbi:hypothetical protein NDU88_004472 [Pleurodeles waltl]|uniref:Uncharacterized protein n=1 Tax=Pleurodeles waltl TaxID=8319 RepID=A0AAV7RGC3_PLEWA|nr:hypothetical protein NDU88_004472 [Pleurodeles waltl]